MSHDYLTKSAALEAYFKKVGKDLIFLTRDQETLTRLLQESIAESEEFQSLPVYRRIAVENWLEGMQVGIAQLLGEEAKGKFKATKSLRPMAARQDVPRRVQNLQPGVQWHQHPNGGGWVSETAYVEATAEVGSRAVVYENASVYGRSRVYGSAHVRGQAELTGSCHVHGLAVVEGQAKIQDAARILGRAVVGGTTVVGGAALVRGSVRLESDEVIADERVVSERGAKHSYMSFKGRAREAG